MVVDAGQEEGENLSANRHVCTTEGNTSLKKNKNRQIIQA